MSKQAAATGAARRPVRWMRVAFVFTATISAELPELECA